LVYRIFMMNIVIITILSVLVVSLVSLVGVVPLILRWKNMDKILLFLVSLSVGSLFGGAFLHLLPEVVEKSGGMTFSISLSVLGGLLFFFIIEKGIHWRHCHIPTSEQHPHHLAAMNLIGDGIHNFIDGLVLSAGYLAGVEVGLATTIAVVVHEVPQEIGDFGVLIYSGLSKTKALFFNFLSALLAVAGAVTGLIIGSSSEQFTLYLLPFAAGGFLYIAGSDLIPELHKECNPKDIFWQFFALILGIGLMLLLKIVFESV